MARGHKNGLLAEMMKNIAVDDSYLIIAAIDFGTTFSAYAYSFRCSPDITHLNKNWAGSDGFESFKAPTSVLTRPEELGDDRFDSFGYEAEEKFSRLEGNTGGRNGYNLYRNFKMLLYKEKVKMTSKVTSTSGYSVYALDIFMMALDYLKNHMLEAIKKSVAKPVDKSDIRWVITVPAIWSDESKRFMRVAAFWAGLIPTEDSDRLVIVLEPEAASIFCRQLNIHNFVGVPEESMDTKFRAGEKFLVIDAGGGTIDITAHEMLLDGSAKEITKPAGGPFGGTMVDEEFISLMKKILGKNFIKSFETSHSEDWVRFVVNFENRKKKFVKGNDIRLPLSWLMGKEYSKFTKKDIEEAFKIAAVEGVSFNEKTGMIIIEPKQALQLFNATIQNTVKLIGSMLKREKKLKNLDYIFLVGGFGECGLLQEECMKVFSGKTKVLVPISAQLAVLKGAVTFGYRPWEIRSRVARLTYGCRTEIPFEEGKHKVEKLQELNGQKMCMDVFQALIMKDEEIELGKTKSFQCKPAQKDQKLDVYIYSTEKDHVVYVDDEGVQKLGEISLKNDGQSVSSELEIRVTFGFTELLIEAIDLKRGKTTAQTSVDFFAKSLVPPEFMCKDKRDEKWNPK